MGTKTLAVLCAIAVAWPRGGSAQDTTSPAVPRVTAQRDSTLRDSIPVSARPPAGMCRIWLADVPVAQQPAPTDCASAVRNRPAKGRVVFGDDYLPRRDSAGKLVPFAKGFAPPKAPPPRKPLQ